MATESGALTVRPLWIITSYENNQREALTLSPDLDDSLLALFSYEEEAEAFVCFLGDGEKEKGWRSEQTTAAELVSVLYEPYANIKGVVLDPLPLELSREMLPLVSMSSDLFLQYLLEERRGGHLVALIHRESEKVSAC
jgi:hypothetical protein